MFYGPIGPLVFLASHSVLGGLINSVELKELSLKVGIETVMRVQLSGHS